MCALKSPKVLFITSGQPSLNPRLVKEADSLAKAGYEVKVLYAYWNDWGMSTDKNFLSIKKWGAVCVGGDPRQKPVIFFLSRLIHKLSTFITRKTRSKLFADFAIARSSYFLIRAAKKHAADLYIGHNLGALPATVKAAKAHKKPCGFDAEDLHRYELSNDDTDNGVILKTYIENKYLRHVNYLTASSEQIGEAYHELFPDKQPITLLNVFPKNPVLKQSRLVPVRPIKLFWFSQVIGERRGIEDAVMALQRLNTDHFELHLLGYHTKETKARFNTLNNGIAKIYYHHPVKPNALLSFSSQFDIGLATEPGFSINNDFALSNKIFTYMQAGLAIIASNTTAQKELMSKYPEIGKVYEKGNTQMLATIVQQYFNNSDDLLRAKKASYKIACEELNWEKESEKFLAIIRNVITI